MTKIIYAILAVNFTMAASAMADCSVARNGQVLAQQPQLELTIIPIAPGFDVEIADDQVSSAVISLRVNGLVIDSKEIDGLKINQAYGADLLGYQINCQ
jgi:hypothetical protein